jgi:hypothetical protein
MAWRFRRSLKLGPLRLNFSKSGVGTSIGVRGFRVGKDAKGRSYTAASVPGTGLYNRQYSSASKPSAAQSPESAASASTQSEMGNGLKIFLAFVAGGVVFSIIGAIMSSSPTVSPAPAPAAVSAPVAPPPTKPARRRAHGSGRVGVPESPHHSATRASHTPQTPPHPTDDAPPPAN